MYTVYPSRISGTIRAPPSKSETHREFILSALADGTSVIRNPLVSADTNATLCGIAALGAKVTTNAGCVSITGGTLHAADDVIDCQNSGTTLRLLTGVAARLDGTTQFCGDASLMRRPMQPLFDALSFACGARFSFHDGVLSVTGSSTPHVRCAEITGAISSQFVSALLLAGVPVSLTSPLVSAPYADMTAMFLQRRGVDVQKTAEGYGGFTGCAGVPEARTVEIGGDWSSAAFLCAAGAVLGDVRVCGLDRYSAQGDRRVLSYLARFGAEVRVGKEVLIASDALHAIDVDVSTTPDLVPPLAVVAANALGTSRFYGVSHLIYKESNRLCSLPSLLERFGVCVSVNADCLSITGTKPHGGAVCAEEDHRLFMAGVVLGLSADAPVQIAGAHFVPAVSYPAFLQDMQSLGGIII